MRSEAFQRFKDEPRAGLFLDFDGTLTDMVPDPADARPMDGAGDLLAELTTRFPVVSVVSGRSAHQLLDWLGPDVEIWGLHGAERTANGKVVLAEDAARYRETMREVLRQAEVSIEELGLSGTILEDKGAMVTFHYRTATDVARAEKELDRLVGELAHEYGLLRKEGKFAYELQPPGNFSKRTVVLERAKQAGLRAAAFAGDDVVDLPGFDAIDELATSGLIGLRIAVDSEESPAPLIERADEVVDGAKGMLELLRELL